MLKPDIMFSEHVFYTQLTIGFQIKFQNSTRSVVPELIGKKTLIMAGYGTCIRAGTLKDHGRDRPQWLESFPAAEKGRAGEESPG